MAISLYAYVFLSGNKDISLQVSLEKAIDACGSLQIPELIQPFERELSLTNIDKERQLFLSVGSIKLSISQGLYIIAHNKQGRTETTANQPDYGEVQKLHLSKSGEVFVFGDQISYRLIALTQNKLPILTKPEPLSVVPQVIVG